MLKDNAMRR